MEKAGPITLIVPSGSKAGDGRIVQTQHGRFRVKIPPNAPSGSMITIQPADFEKLDLPRIQHRPPCWACLAPLEWDRAEAELCKACNVVCTHCGALSTPPRWRKVKRKPYLAPMRILGWMASTFNMMIMPVIMLGNVLFAVPWWAKQHGWSGVQYAAIECGAMVAAFSTLFNFWVAVKVPIPRAMIPEEHFTSMAATSSSSSSSSKKKKKKRKGGAAEASAAAAAAAATAKDEALTASQLKMHFATLPRMGIVAQSATTAQLAALTALLPPPEAAADATLADEDPAATNADAAARATLTRALLGSVPTAATPLLKHGSMLGWSWCHLSEGPKAPRAHYSHTDGACIPVMDHFCPYLGTCVGAHNHAPFLRYLFALWFSCIYLSSVSAWMLPHLVEQLPVRAWGLLSGDQGYHQDLYYFCKGAGMSTGQNMIGQPLGGAAYSKAPLAQPNVHCTLEYMLSLRAAVFGLLAANGLIATIVTLLIPVLLFSQLTAIFNGLRTYEVSFLTTSLMSTRMRFARATRLANLATICAKRPAALDDCRQEADESQADGPLAGHYRCAQSVTDAGALPPVPSGWCSIATLSWLIVRPSEVRANVAECSALAAIARVDLSSEGVKHPTMPGDALIAPGSLRFLGKNGVGWCDCCWRSTPTFPGAAMMGGRGKKAKKNKWSKKKADPEGRDGSDEQSFGVKQKGVRRRKGGKK